MSRHLDWEISQAFNEMAAVIHSANGPIFADEDHGRLLRSFMKLCDAIANQDREFKAKAREAERIEARSKAHTTSKLSRAVDEIFGSADK